jgi:hypothetical protein
VTPDDINVPINVYFGRTILLLGYSPQSQPVQIGNPIEVTLYWKAIGMPEGDFTAFVNLVDAEGATVGQEDSVPLDGQCPTRIWQPGEVISDTHVVDVDRIGAGGPYQLAVSMRDWRGDPLSPFDSLGHHFPDDQVTLSVSTVSAKRESVPTPQNPQTARLGDTVKLRGYDLGTSTMRPGESIAVTLYWQCVREMITSYTVFTHLIDDKGEIRDQSDSIPVAGERPTAGWLTDEVIVDHHIIPLQEEAPPGDYQIEAGMYDFGSGQRLPVTDETGRRAEFDRVLLDTPIQVGQR